MVTSYEKFEKLLWLSKTSLVQRTTFGVILLVRTAFELSGTTGRLQIWITTLDIMDNVSTGLSNRLYSLNNNNT